MLHYFIRFGIDYFKGLFPISDYKTISIRSSYSDDAASLDEDFDVSATDVLIYVTDHKPQHGVLAFEEVKYKARVITLTAKPSGGNFDNPSNFYGKRFLRHDGFNNWWVQERGINAPELTCKYTYPRGISQEAISSLEGLPLLNDADVYYYVTIYVKIKTESTDKYRLDFHRSLGGQVHVFCGCCRDPFPLIISGQSKRESTSCRNPDCSGRQHYVCPQSGCKTGICNKCFDSYPEDTRSFLKSDPIDNDDVENVDSDNSIDDDSVSDGDDDDVDSVPCDSSLEDDDADLLDIDDDESILSDDVFDEESDDEIDDDTELGSYDDDSVSSADEDDNTAYSSGDSCQNYSPRLVRHQSLRDRMTSLRRHLAQTRDQELCVPCGGDNHDSHQLEEFVTTGGINPIDTEGSEGGTLSEVLPKTMAGDFASIVMPRDSFNAYPCHVLFNQVGALCTRYNKKIKGTQVQQNFIQRMVSTIQGVSIPLVYIMGACFPRHFYASSSRDRCSILGCPPISCYTGVSNANGFASSLSIARNLGTHSSSSTSTCPIFWSFLYDIQANRVASEYDSRLIGRRGFKVDIKSKNGIVLREGENKSVLTESVDSHQSALDLAATMKYLDFDLFLTWTCNQSDHPGIKHLHQYKERMAWTKNVMDYDRMGTANRLDVKKSFEQAYGSILGRCWMEVRKLWLEYITFSTSSILKKVTNSFFRDEYQEESGNLAHIHGLISLDRRDLSNEEFREFVTGLQKSAVCDLFDTKKVDDFIAQGLFENEGDWKVMTAKASKILTHKCDQRCKRRVSSDNEGPESFVCRKPHTVFSKNDPLVDEMIPLKYEFSPACLDALRCCGLWDPPTEFAPNGTFHSDILEPKRHFGAIHPGARCNMSPVIPEFFAATQSMQNVQILHGTNGVAAYVVKYVVKMDKGNRVTVWADANNGNVVKAEHQFLHNTKITSSGINEEKAHERSRRWKHPEGRAIAFPEIQQSILGYSEVMTNLKFIRICTKPFELRSTTKIKLNNKGNLERPDRTVQQASNLPPDASSGLPPVLKARRRKFPQLSDRQMSTSQKLLHRNNVKCGAFDKITQYSLRPIELMQIVRNIGNYYRWFEIEKKTLEEPEIESLLSEDVTRCAWIDGLGRRIRLRKGSLGEVKTHLLSLDLANLKEHSIMLRAELLRMIEDEDDKALFVFDDKGVSLPIPVFSSITPNHGVPFLLHIMLMLGEYDTELDLRFQSTIRESLSAVGLIGNSTDADDLKGYSIQLVKRTVEDVLSVQPVSLRRLDDYIVKAKILFDSVIVRNEIPVHDLPPCILTELLDRKDELLDKLWKDKRRDQLNTIYNNMPDGLDLPSKSCVEKCDKSSPLQWEPLSAFRKSDNQNEESHMDQKLGVKLAANLISKYSTQFGPSTSTLTKGLLIHGAPGSGKSHVILFISLMAMAMGLRVITTALMGVRANALGGIHLHRLFAMLARKKGNPYRLAELAMDKLSRKTNLGYLHILLTVDVLIIDECGQLSADQLSTLDIILRNLRNNSIPFGGVLIFGTMDHTQLGAIGGWPFLLSSHVLTHFLLVKLSHSVRAHGDEDFQKIQNYTRMSPNMLLSDPEHERIFKELVGDCFDYAESWDDPKIDPQTQRMYGNRMPAYEASREFVESCKAKFDGDGTLYTMSVALNFQRTVGTRSEYSRVVSDDVLRALNHELREPEKLIFYRGAQFEATLNGDGYSQSQLLLMIDVPHEEEISNKALIPMMAAPPNVSYLDMSDGIPSVDDLKASGWKDVRVGHAPESAVTCGGSVGRRVQYSLKHIGASTINKQLGNTIKGKCAVECSEQCSPFCKEQVVVGLSRTCCARDTIIVGDRSFAVNRLWDLITIGNQWTDYIETLLERLSINGGSGDEHYSNFNQTQDFPYRTCDLDVPDARSGYVYMLVSVRDFDRDYIGQSDTLSRRINEHQAGRGSLGTCDPYYMPYTLAAYMCLLNGIDQKGREDLEKRWKEANHIEMERGNTDLLHRIEQGNRIVKEYNSCCTSQEDHIRFVVTIERDVASFNDRNETVALLDN